MKAMSDSGLAAFKIGVESGVQKLLETLGSRHYGSIRKGKLIKTILIYFLVPTLLLDLQKLFLK